jgi:hypothetical protein
MVKWIAAIEFVSAFIAGDGAASVSRRTPQVRWPVGMHLVLLLHLGLPEPLVERGSISRPCCTASGLALAGG